jgi:hypothetical protein
VVDLTEGAHVERDTSVGQGARRGRAAR